jgi:hypothetical protein
MSWLNRLTNSFIETINRIADTVMKVIHTKQKTNKPVIYWDYWLLTSYTGLGTGFCNVGILSSTILHNIYLFFIYSYNRKLQAAFCP